MKGTNVNRRFKQTATTCLDSYKLGHADQYAPGTKYVFSNFTPRADRLFSGKKNSNYDGKIVVAGIRAFISEMHYIFKETFFCVPIEKAISEFEEICSSFGSIDKMKTRLIRLHKLGKLPLIIRGLPEGSVVNPGIPVLFITNTDENFYWLPNFLETWISSELWKCMTSATTARLYRKILNKFVIETGSSPEFANWQIHDFSLRGQGGIKDGANSGLGHLMFSSGTDNIPAAKMIHDIYGDNAGSFAGSVPASEHSTSSSNILVNAGKGISLDEAESEFFKRYITEIYPSGICSYVADTYDYWKLLTEILPKNKEAIVSRDGKVVIRPDSGDPVRIICGYRISEKNELGTEVIHKDGKYYLIEDQEYKDNLIEIPWYEALGSIRVLAKIFGKSMNEKKYFTVNQKVGIIYGDSITLERCQEILERLAEMKYAADNIVFGVGSYTYQYVTRDTFGFAIKATWVQCEDVSYPIYKDPKTDGGTKKSAKGLLRVVKDENGEYELLQNQEKAGYDETVVYYLEGAMPIVESFSKVKQRAMESV